MAGGRSRMYDKGVVDEQSSVGRGRMYDRVRYGRMAELIPRTNVC